MLQEGIVKVGLFKVDTVFTVTNRGLYIGGQITEGTITIGNSIYIEDRKIKIKILNVEIGHSGNLSLVGLNINVKNIMPEVEIDELKGQILHIIS